MIVVYCFPKATALIIVVSFKFKDGRFQRKPIEEEKVTNLHMIIKLDIENLHKPWINELDSNPGSFSSPMSKRFGAELPRKSL